MQFPDGFLFSSMEDSPQSRAFEESLLVSCFMAFSGQLAFLSRVSVVASSFGGDINRGKKSDSFYSNLIGSMCIAAKSIFDEERNLSLSIIENPRLLA